MADSRLRDEAAIRGIIEGWSRALHAKDADALTAHHAPDLLSYDLAPPLATRGPDLPGLKAWLAGWEGPIDHEIRDLNIEAGDDVAFSTSLNRMRATSTGGKQVDLWTRATIGFRKVDGRWLVVHEHVSVPFHMDGSERAALDLKP
jgi:ketosteroid isomerase-like protein